MKGALLRGWLTPAARRDLPAWGLFSVLLVVFVLLLGAPVWYVLRGGFTDESGGLTFAWVARVFGNVLYREGLTNSLGIALGTVVCSSLLALPPAWLVGRFRFPGHGFYAMAFLIPMIMPPFVGAIGLMHGLGPYGALNSFLGCGPIDWLAHARMAGVIGLQSLALYPLIYINLLAAFSQLDGEREEAAHNLGAGHWLTLRRIVFPALLPGYFAGAVLVFIASFTELGVPLMLCYQRCASVQIFDALNDIGATPFPYALVSVVMAVSVVSYIVGKCCFERGRSLGAFKQGSQQQTRPLHGWQRWGAMAFCTGLLCLAALPHLGVVLTAFAEPGTWYRTVLPQSFTLENFRLVLGHEMTAPAIRNSWIYSLLALALTLIIGFAVSWISERSHLRCRRIVDVCAMLPLAVPGLVMAFGFLAVSQAWGFNLVANPLPFLVAAYAIRRLPYMVRAISAGFALSPAVLEEAALNLGASFRQRLCRITLPLLAPQMVAGAILTFAFCMLEVSDSLILAQTQRVYPVTKAIFEFTSLVGIGEFLAAALGVWALILLALAFATGRLFAGKQINGLFKL